MDRPGPRSAPERPGTEPGCRPGPGSVLCTHGDVMASIVTTLAAAHLPMRGGMQWAKAGTWAFSISHGQIVGGRYLPPPA